MHPLLLANLVEFDQVFGRQRSERFAGELEQFDRRLPQIRHALGDDALLIITADHGNDPTTPSTDHSRERVPVLCTGTMAKPADLGVRESFTDCGATVLELLGVDASVPGRSFATTLRA